MYFWRDDGGKILYIGKATSLRDRVRSYFSPDVIKTRGAHIVDMVFTAVNVEYQETMNALEALILEANLDQEACTLLQHQGKRRQKLQLCGYYP